MEIRRITSELLPAFRPYLVPQAARDIEEGLDRLVAVGAVNEKFRTCGAAAILLDEKSRHCTLVSLFVDPKVRRHGIAGAMLERLDAICKMDSAFWTAAQSEQEALSACLQSRGFQVTVEQESVMRLDCDAMTALPVCRRAFQPSFRPDPNVISFADVSEEELKELSWDDSIPEALRPHSFEEEVLHSPLSLAYRYQGVIAAYFLATPCEDGAVVQAAVSRKRYAHGAAFFQLASAAMHRSLPYLPRQGGCYWLQAINPESEKLARFLCGDHFQLWQEGYAQRGPT